MGSERRPATTLLHVGGRATAIRVRGFAFEILSGADAGRSIRGDKRSFLLGTHASADVVLADPHASRLHARLDVEDADYVLRDLGSTNGTRVGGTRVREACLEDGAIVEIGATRVRFRVLDEPFEVRLAEDDRFEELIGRSVAMRELFAVCERVAPTDAPVIIGGETGTGKELVARAIHRRSRRAGKPLVVLDCSAIPPSLVESELFGHERGAFTGAVATRPGVFERGDGGTVFLDELGELPIELQPKLLRCLESGELTRVGGDRTIRVDIRVLAATNRDLPRMIAEGRFRADLFYRLAVIRVTVPALRDRRDDIPLLAAHFAAAALAGRARSPLPPETLEALFGELTRHDWPGNVRELRNAVERAAILADPRILHGGATEQAAVELQRSIEKAVHRQGTLRAARAEREREYLTDLLRATEGNLDEAARIAQVHRKSLERLIRRHKLRDPR
ncbi:MAG TPA: sigma 54-interacting transcriptional regulator [Kofleriaceae bacterium]|nr:sigma 54-interacting transcriptional regulator [Kofleriaceae bacterium]